jgi:hypothetical protein
MNRRAFISLLGATAWPLAAGAQQPDKIKRVGYIRAGTPNNDPYREEFVRGMRDLGYVEGRNIAYEFRHYGDDAESIPALISDLLRGKGRYHRGRRYRCAPRCADSNTEHPHRHALVQPKQRLRPSQSYSRWQRQLRSEPARAAIPAAWPPMQS